MLPLPCLNFIPVQRRRPNPPAGLHPAMPITACQCFMYFDKDILLPKIYRMLKTDGHFAVLFMAWLPEESEIANHMSTYEPVQINLYTITASLKYILLYARPSSLGIQGQKVLDIGTGTGVLPRNMYAYGADWTGAPAL